MKGYDPKFPDQPTREEDDASLSSLNLAPWVEEQARALREAHYKARLGEPLVNTRSKVSKWRRGAVEQRGGFHRL